MSQKTLNLGILAHVDAGKTTLTERLLYDSGVIDQLGAVDAGTTQTDSLALERRRGITIKSAVASFPIGDVTVNLIDTPGHPDFIAEVDRVLNVLDGVVLVISAVEGVQAQTRILMRSLQRLEIPAVLFVNKIDRGGANPESVLAEIVSRLKVTAFAMGRGTSAGTHDADFIESNADDPEFTMAMTELLAEHNDGLLATYLQSNSGVPYEQLRKELTQQMRRGQVYPVFFGSAITGAGIPQLMAGITELLPASDGDSAGPQHGSIFKIERGGSGEKIAYVRMFSGTVHVRDRLHFGSGLDDKVTAVAVFERGPAAVRQTVSAGQIGKLWGLGQARIGDRIGEFVENESRPQFPPPTLESAVVPCDPHDGNRLRTALGQLAEQDPLINLRQNDERQEIYVSLYGAVQKEVIQSTLADDFDVAATFRETTMICIERPLGCATSLEVLQSDSHPYSATVGLRVEPGPADCGIQFRLDFDPRRVPLYIYKTVGHFAEAMSKYIEEALDQGLYGWRVTDCVVTMNECNYYVGDGAAKAILPTPRTTAADFRKLTPLVVMDALRQAGTVVCQPITSVRLELPASRMGEVLSALARLGAVTQMSQLETELSVVTAMLPSAHVRSLQEQLPGLTGGEGVIDASFGGYEPIHGRFPTRSW
ncbi:MAG TPA: translation factor GTPase family protein [Streptosporangiaceae bacterium]|nr:translation factor GTPase family protein [Streptosporangiaceae bacterium]